MHPPNFLVQYADKTFGLEESGQRCLLYSAPHAPSRQKLLNSLVPDDFYCQLFISPCLSGWDRGEAKYRYMELCHKTLSRSQLNTIGKLKDAGIITNNLVVLPNTSNTCLANNGTHVSLGSRVLTAMARDQGSPFTPLTEKYFGDLVIKIVEHFLPLFVNTYSAAPYRIDFGEFHPGSFGDSLSNSTLSRENSLYCPRSSPRDSRGSRDRRHAHPPRRNYRTGATADRHRRPRSGGTLQFLFLKSAIIKVGAPPRIQRSHITIRMARLILFEAPEWPIQCKGEAAVAQCFRFFRTQTLLLSICYKLLHLVVLLSHTPGHRSGGQSPSNNFLTRCNLRHLLTVRRPIRQSRSGKDQL